MTSASYKLPSVVVYPKSLLSIAASMGGLAVFLILASSYLISQSGGSTVRGYIYGVDHSPSVDYTSAGDETVLSFRQRSDINNNILDGNGTTDDFQGSDGEFGDSGKSNPSISQGDKSVAIGQAIGKGNEAVKNSRRQEFGKIIPAVLTGSRSREAMGRQMHSHVAQLQKRMNATQLTSPDSSLNDVIPSPPASTNTSHGSSVDSGCDLYSGKWVYDSGGPLYTNGSCPVLTQTQNCQGNGRPDKGYENWRWKPTHCDIPRFDARKFLDLMRGKTLAFVGDSIARNQMESMLCILWQVEVPENKGNRRMQRYYFASTSTTIVRIWSAWLVHQTSEQFDFAPAGVEKLHLDAPDEGFMEFIPNFDIIVLSSGHWFVKQSVYILNNEVVGGQLWWPEKSRQMKINNIEAFGISVETILSAMVTHPNYTGLTIVRTFSPDHYKGGLWNTGGSCTGKVKPLMDGTELVENEFTNIMHKKQVAGFSRAIKKKTNKSRLKLMDITEAFAYRHDGHPGPYRSTDPNKITKRGPDGKPPPQDCLHWCMPGPVDTWNEILFEIIKRELDRTRDVSL